MTPIKLKLARLKRNRVVPDLGDRTTFEGPTLVLLPCGGVHVGGGRIIPLGDFEDVVMETSSAAMLDPPGPTTAAVEPTNGPVQPPAAGSGPRRKRT